MASTLSIKGELSTTAFECAVVRAALYGSSGDGRLDYLAKNSASSCQTFLGKLGFFLIKIGQSNLTLKIASRVSPGGYVLLFYRAFMADELIRKMSNDHDCVQVVILGSGLDTSAFRLSKELEGNGEISFFELDLPEMQKVKTRIMKKVQKNTSDFTEVNVDYKECTFGMGEIIDKLNDSDFDKNKPTVWVWTGVVHYLNESSVDETLREVKELSSPGSKIIFDYPSLVALDNPVKYGLDKLKKRFESFGEVMSFGLSDKESDLKDWMNERGYLLQDKFNYKKMSDKFKVIHGQEAPSAGAEWAHVCVAEVV